MPGEVKITGCQVFRGLETLVKGRCVPEPADQFIRHRGAGIDVPGIGLQDLRFHRPVLHDLRWQFDEILLDAGS